MPAIDEGQNEKRALSCNPRPFWVSEEIAVPVPSGYGPLVTPAGYESDPLGLAKLGWLNALEASARIASFMLSQGNENDLPAVLKYVSTPDEEAPDVTLERAELERLIASAIDKIPKVEKTVLSLYFYEELTLREIAQIMGIHLSRVSQIKSQAILRLRTAMARNWPGLR